MVKMRDDFDVSTKAIIAAQDFTVDEAASFDASIEDSPIAGSTVRGLEFIAWVQAKYPNLDLLASLPTAELTKLATDFCTERAYPDADQFASDVLNWARGSGDRAVLNKLADIGEQVKRDNATYRPAVGSPFKRYQTVPYHSIFLFDEQGNFGKFVKKYWVQLNALTGDLLDFYYSHSDLVGQASAYTVIEELRSVQVDVTLLPAMLLWTDQLEDGILISFRVGLRKLSDNKVYQLLKVIIQSIKEGKELAEVGNEAAKVIRETLGRASVVIKVNSITGNSGPVVLGSQNTVSASEAAVPPATPPSPQPTQRRSRPHPPPPKPD